MILTGSPVDTNGNLYVANTGNETIEIITTNGQGSVFADLNPYDPFDLAFDNQGNLYADAAGPDGVSILKLDSLGNMSVFVTTTQEFGFAGMAFDTNGNLYTANSYSTIVRFDVNGLESNFASGFFYNPGGLAFDSKGNLYVSSYGSDAIAKFDPNGNGSTFTSSSLLSFPLGIAFDSRDNLYVANQWNENVLKFASNGAGSILAGGLGNAVGIAVYIPEVVANFTANPTGGFPPLPVTFTDTSSGVVTNWFWSFGDGVTTNVTTNSVIHTYNNAGPYTVTEIVAGPHGVSTNVQPNYINAFSLVVINTGDSGVGSLRQAVLSANQAGGGTILFSNVTGTVTLTSGEIAITNNVNILGPGPTNLTISGFSSRAFDISSNCTASISSLVLQGSTNANGGAVYNLGSLVLSNCVVTASSCNGNIYVLAGGGIYNAGTMAMYSCVVSNDFAAGYEYGLGGGIYNTGVLSLVSCVISGNGCGTSGFFNGRPPPPGTGGGVYNANVLTVTNCIITGNNSGPGIRTCGSVPGNGGPGGGVYNSGTATIIASTVSQNSAGAGGSGGCNLYSGGNGGDGGGFWNGGSLIMIGCMISSNSAGAGGYGTTYAYPQFGGNGGSGGGIYNVGTLALTNCTIANNASGDGGYGDDFGNGGIACGGANGGSGGGIWGAGALVAMPLTF